MMASDWSMLMASDDSHSRPVSFMQSKPGRKIFPGRYTKGYRTGGMLIGWVLYMLWETEIKGAGVWPALVFNTDGQ